MSSEFVDSLNGLTLTAPGEGVDRGGWMDFFAAMTSRLRDMGPDKAGGFRGNVMKSIREAAEEKGSLDAADIEAVIDGRFEPDAEFKTRSRGASRKERFGIDAYSDETPDEAALIEARAIFKAHFARALFLDTIQERLSAGRFPGVSTNNTPTVAVEGGGDLEASVHAKGDRTITG